METKYYTPTIEEFHVGFECEVLYDGNYEKCKIQIGILDQNLVGRLNKPNKLIDVVLTDESIVNFRIKRLDRDDIESLDFELDCCVKKEWFYIHKKSNLQDGTIRLTFRQKEQSVEISWVKSGNYFYGKIKNKSELKKLMQQLNIE